MRGPPKWEEWISVKKKKISKIMIGWWVFYSFGDERQHVIKCINGKFVSQGLEFRQALHCECFRPLLPSLQNFHVFVSYELDTQIVQQLRRKFESSLENFTHVTLGYISFISRTLTSFFKMVWFMSTLLPPTVNQDCSWENR